MTPLPRPIDESPVADLQDLARRVFAHSRQVDEHLRLLPISEERVVDIDPADLPLTLQVEMERVRGVVRLCTVATETGDLVPETGIAWQPSTDPGAPGVVVSELEGTSAGTAYRCTFLIVGRRD